MTSLREEIYNLTYEWCVEANYETHKFIDELYQLFEKRIDERYNEFENHRNEENIIKTEFGSGYLQGLRDVKEILK